MIERDLNYSLEQKSFVLSELLDNFKLMVLPKAMAFLANETDFIKRLIFIFTMAHFHPNSRLERHSVHVEYEDEIFNEELVDLEMDLI